jgi:hypothetical protein
MTGPAITPADERPRPPGTDPLWCDSWYIDWAEDAGRGGFVAIALWPNLNLAWWWSYVVPGDGTFIGVRDHEVLPPRSGLEVRADGLWGALFCETPLEHWTVGLEAFALRFDDDRAAAWDHEYGDRLPLGLDLSWEALTAPVRAPAPGPARGAALAYVQAGTVTGEILLGPSGALEADGRGLLARRSGVADWWAPGVVGSAWAGLVDSDGAAVASAEGADDGNDPGSPELPAVFGHPDRHILAVLPMLITDPGGRKTRLARALTRFGETVGWAEQVLQSG